MRKSGEDFSSFSFFCSYSGEDGLGGNGVKPKSLKWRGGCGWLEDKEGRCRCKESRSKDRSQVTYSSLTK